MEWRPKRWLAVLLNLFISPLGFLYIQRPRLAVGYLLATLTLLILTVALAVKLGLGFSASALVMVGWMVGIIGVIHVFRLAGASPPIGTRHWYSRWYGLIGVLLVFYGLLVVFRSFLFEPFRIPSHAMHPTLPEGSLVFVKKLGYGDYGSLGWQIRRVPATADVSRGELLLFRLPDNPETVYVKRVIGLPGEHVECLEQQIVIDGTPIAAQTERTGDLYHYVRESIDGASYTVTHLPARPAIGCDVVVPEGHYFMLGDNRENSRDSRYFGTVSRDTLVGRVVLILPAVTSL